MRSIRIKYDSRERECVYHCTSKSVDGSMMFDARDRWAFQQILRRVSQFCGVQLQTFALMSNHFHVVVQVPLWQTPSDEEVVRRYRILYPPTNAQRAFRLRAIEQMYLKKDKAFAEWKQRQVKQMGDISHFMKLAKQIFAAWYNFMHKRIGPVFRGRFHSVIISAGFEVIMRVCAYVDSNPLRAGLVLDPKDTLDTGYGLAVSGNEEARRGLCAAFGSSDWEEVGPQYRMLLYQYGSKERGGKYALPAEEVAAVLRRAGRLSYLEELRCRMRYYLQGQLIGDYDAVRRLADQLRARGSPRRKKPFKLPSLPGISGLYSLQSTHLKDLLE